MRSRQFLLTAGGTLATWKLGIREGVQDGDECSLRVRGTAGYHPSTHPPIHPSTGQPAMGGSTVEVAFCECAARYYQLHNEEQISEPIFISTLVKTCYSHNWNMWIKLVTTSNNVTELFTINFFVTVAVTVP